jgi:H+/Cl- antiporter ClcA
MKSFLAGTLKNWNPLHNQNYIKAAQLAAASMVGFAAYLYAKLFTLTHSLFMRGFGAHPCWSFLGAPLLFLVAAWLVTRFAPEAKGSGIPQVLKAIEEAGPEQPQALSSPLVSFQTAVFKVLSSTLGLLGGASIGREGPTVQIASSLFALVGRQSKRFFAVQEYRSFLIAGGAAGIAAAFNTPLAGITFALEEIAESTFSQFKRTVMLSVIIGGITAQALGGNYLYFGHPIIQQPSLSIFPVTIAIGLFGGFFGGLFARCLSTPMRFLPKSWWLRALLCGALCSVFCLFSAGTTAGSGYETTRKFMDSSDGSLPILFFPEKFLTTVFSYLSGMAGGIFSPSLSIGAGMGCAIAQLFHMVNLKACALIGMVAFFSGAVQAPLTAVVIIMEMTDQNAFIVPFMIAAFLAHGIGKLVMPIPLYRYLAFQSDRNESNEKTKT